MGIKLPLFYHFYFTNQSSSCSEGNKAAALEPTHLAILDHKPRALWFNLSILLIVMTSRLALKRYNYALFYFPLDNTLAPAKTSKIVSSMANVKEGAMVEVNWDTDNPKIPAKIIALAGK